MDGREAVGNIAWVTFGGKERSGRHKSVDGGETVGNSFGRALRGRSDTEATRGWTEGKPCEIAWGELRWEGTIRK